jgi:hypothetical protein
MSGWIRLCVVAALFATIAGVLYLSSEPIRRRMDSCDHSPNCAYFTEGTPLSLAVAACLVLVAAGVWVWLGFRRK